MADNIEFFFDIGSPYSYLAATQMDALAKRTGATVHWRPFLLGGVFKAVGNTPPAALELKRDWMLGDLNMWADHYDVPFQMSSHFPVNSLLPQRALTAANTTTPERLPQFALELYRDYWADDRDVSKASRVQAAAERAGFDGERLVAMAAEQPIKDKLRAVTDEAVDRGAFGAPTFFVGEQMFWGNDRLHFVEKAASGQLG